MEKKSLFENSSDDILYNTYSDNDSYNFLLNKLLEQNSEDLFSTKEKSKNEINTEKKNELLKKKRGRRKKNDNNNDSDIVHSKYKNDNIIYKLKTNCMKNILYLLNNLIMKKYNRKNFKLQKIAGEILKDGKKNSNLIFFKSLIKGILLMERTKKIKNKEVIENKTIIQKIEEDNDELLNEILNYNFNDYLKNIFICISKKDFETNFKVECKFLFYDMDIDEKEKKIMIKIVKNDLIKYYENIKERTRKKRNYEN